MFSAYIFHGENNATEQRRPSTSSAIRYHSLFYEETHTTTLHM